MFEFLEHLFENAHSILIATELVNVLDGVVKELIHKLNWEDLDYLLNKVGGVIVGTKLVKVLSDLVENQEILVVSRQEWQEVLESVSSLLVHHDIAQTRDKHLQNQKLSFQIANRKQLLHHVISILMLHQLNKLPLHMLNYHIYFRVVRLLQETLEWSWLRIVLYETLQGVCLDQFLQVDLLVVGDLLRSGQASFHGLRGCLSTIHRRKADVSFAPVACIVGAGFSELPVQL